MAKIEMALVASYRQDLITHCEEAAFIRTRIESLLDSACTATAVTTNNPDTNKRESRMVRKFYFADRIRVQKGVEITPPHLDLQQLMSRRVAVARSSALASESMTALTRLGRVKAASATPDNKTMDPEISDAITNLQSVGFQIFKLRKRFLFNIITYIY
jgi:hypothetical protein